MMFEDENAPVNTSCMAGPQNAQQLTQARGCRSMWPTEPCVTHEQDLQTPEHPVFSFLALSYNTEY